MKRILFRHLSTPPHRPHVGITHFRPDQVSLRHSHDFFEIFLVTLGAGTHHINQATVPISCGNLVVIRPEDCHHFSSSESLSILNVAMAAQWWKSFHQLMGAALSEDWHGLGTPPGHLRLSSGESREIQRAFQQLGNPANRAPSDLVQVLLRVIDLFESSRRLSLPTPPAWLDQWKTGLMEAGEEIAEPIQYWQKRSSRSAEHLARSCRLYFQSTPTDLLNHFRIERAKMLLGSTQEKVVSIAFSCGFGNLANFYRNFAAHTGMTPNAWRRQGAATVPLA